MCGGEFMTSGALSNHPLIQSRQLVAVAAAVPAANGPRGLDTVGSVACSCLRTVAHRFAVRCVVCRKRAASSRSAPALRLRTRRPTATTRHCTCCWLAATPHLGERWRPWASLLSVRHSTPSFVICSVTTKANTQFVGQAGVHEGAARTVFACDIADPDEPACFSALFTGFTMSDVEFTHNAPALLVGNNAG